MKTIMILCPGIFSSYFTFPKKACPNSQLGLVLLCFGDKATAKDFFKNLKFLGTVYLE